MTHNRYTVNTSELTLLKPYWQLSLALMWTIYAHNVRYGNTQTHLRFSAEALADTVGMVIQITLWWQEIIWPKLSIVPRLKNSYLEQASTANFWEGSNSKYFGLFCLQKKQPQTMGKWMSMIVFLITCLHKQEAVWIWPTAGAAPTLGCINDFLSFLRKSDGMFHWFKWNIVETKVHTEQRGAWLRYGYSQGPKTPGIVGKSLFRASLGTHWFYPRALSGSSHPLLRVL